MLVKVTVIVESTDDELVTTTLPTRIDTKYLNYPTVKWLWEFITRDKLAAAKRKLRVFDVLSIRERSKGIVFLETTGINRRSKTKRRFQQSA